MPELGSRDARFRLVAFVNVHAEPTLLTDYSDWFGRGGTSLEKNALTRRTADPCHARGRRAGQFEVKSRLVHRVRQKPGHFAFPIHPKIVAAVDPRDEKRWFAAEVGRKVGPTALQLILGGIVIGGIIGETRRKTFVPRREVEGKNLRAGGQAAHVGEKH